MLIINNIFIAATLMPSRNVKQVQYPPPFYGGKSPAKDDTRELPSRPIGYLLRIKPVAQGRHCHCLCTEQAQCEKHQSNSLTEQLIEEYRQFDKKVINYVDMPMAAFVEHVSERIGRDLHQPKISSIASQEENAIVSENVTSTNGEAARKSPNIQPRMGEQTKTNELASELNHLDSAINRILRRASRLTQPIQVQQRNIQDISSDNEIDPNSPVTTFSDITSAQSHVASFDYATINDILFQQKLTEIRLLIHKMQGECSLLNRRRQLSHNRSISEHITSPTTLRFKATRTSQIRGPEKKTPRVIPKPGYIHPTRLSHHLDREELHDFELGDARIEFYRDFERTMYKS